MTEDAGGPPARRRTDPFTVFLVVACLALAVLVVMLALENRDLKSQIASHDHGPRPDELATGDRIESAVLAGSDGKPVRVEFPAPRRTTLLLVFTSTCPACARTFPVWRDVLRDGPRDLRVVGVQLDRPSGGPASPELTALNLPFAIHGPGDPVPPFLKKVGSVPATIVVGPDGTVRKAWYGTLDDERQQELRREIRS